MPFRHGTVAYRRYRVVGDAPEAPTTELVETLSQNVVRPPSVGAPPELQVGWCAGQHVLDGTFDLEAIAFGASMLFGMRLDTCRVPPELKRAYRAQAERASAQASPTGFLNRAERLAAKEESEARCRQELADGLHRSSRMYPILWDMERGVVLAPTMADAASCALVDLFQTTFDLRLEPQSAGTLAEVMVDRRGLSRDFDDARPSQFTPPPPGAAREDGRDVSVPVVPWSYAGPETRDFLGNEFLMWLWHEAEVNDGLMTTGRGDVAIVVDHMLDTECAWDVSGKQSLRADGPTRLPEARRALQSGKWPRKIGLILAAHGEQWQATLQGDQWRLSGLRLPKPEDGAKESPRETVERRVASIMAADDAMVALFEAFLVLRLSSAWATRTQVIARWIASSGRPAPEIMVDPKVDVAMPSSVSVASA